MILIFFSSVSAVKIYFLIIFLFGLFFFNLYSVAVNSRKRRETAWKEPGTCASCDSGPSPKVNWKKNLLFILVISCCRLMRKSNHNFILLCKMTKKIFNPFNHFCFLSRKKWRVAFVVCVCVYVCASVRVKLGAVVLHWFYQ